MPSLGYYILIQRDRKIKDDKKKTPDCDKKLNNTLYRMLLRSQRELGFVGQSRLFRGIQMMKRKQPCKLSGQTSGCGGLRQRASLTVLRKEDLIKEDELARWTGARS